jgi:hypothetical protein
MRGLCEVFGNARPDLEIQAVEVLADGQPLV